MPGNPGVVGGMLGIAMAKVVLHGAQIGALVGEVVATGVAEHMWRDPGELRLLAGKTHDVVDGMAGELCLALGDKQPGQAVFPGGKVAFDGPELVAIGCSTDKEPLRRSTQRRDRLTSRTLRRIWMASQTRRPCL